LEGEESLVADAPPERYDLDEKRREKRGGGGGGVARQRLRQIVKSARGKERGGSTYFL